MRNGNGSADRAAVVVLLVCLPLVRREHGSIARVLRDAELVEVIVRVQIFVLENVKSSAVKLVASTFRREVLDTAGGATLGRRDDRGRHLELCQRLDAWCMLVKRRVAVHTAHVDAVQQFLGAEVLAAGCFSLKRARGRGGGRGSRADGARGKKDEAFYRPHSALSAQAERQIHDLAIRNGVGDLGVFRLHDGRVFIHRPVSPAPPAERCTSAGDTLPVVTRMPVNCCARNPDAETVRS